jgi:hypothetical protein
MSSGTTRFETGAQRSSDVDDLRFDLIHPIIMFALARTYGEGAPKYGQHNCEQGFPIGSLISHAQAHIWRFMGGDRSEPHLEHALWGIGHAIVEATLRPDHPNNAGFLRGPGCTLTPEMLRRMADELERCAEFRRTDAAKELSSWTTADVAAKAKLLPPPPSPPHTVDRPGVGGSSTLDRDEIIDLFGGHHEA